MKTNKLSCGLFMYHGKYWWRNFKDIHIFIKRIFFVLKHGYSPVAKWETFAWFIDVMKEILTNYRYNRYGSPIIIDDYFNEGNRDEKNKESYDQILDKMIALLDKMDESNPLYDDIDWATKDESMSKAKDEFFKLFSEHFYDLWD